MKTLLGSKLATLSPSAQATVTGRSFFPRLISNPFMHGLRIALTVALIMLLIAAVSSWLRGGKFVAVDDDEIGAVGAFGAPQEVDGRDHVDEAPVPDEWLPA
jgi:hypothetical protein